LIKFSKAERKQRQKIHKALNKKLDAFIREMEKTKQSPTEPARNQPTEEE